MSKTLILLIILFSCCLSIVLSSMPDRPPLVNDSHDVSIYQERGSWILSGQQPYRDVFSEYPQLATYLFAIPHVISNFLDGGRTYRYVFSLMMAICLAISTVLIYKLRPDRKYLAFLMFLPASVYFTHNRYDIVPSLFIVASLVLLFKDRFYLSIFLLAISVMFKWYPVVLVPIFVSYYYTLYGRINWIMVGIFLMTIILIITPTILLIDWEGFLIPYLYHLQRGINKESLLYLIIAVFKYFGLYRVKVESYFVIAFLLFQFAIPVLSVFGKVNDKSKVIWWSTSSILCFMLFAKFYSPQWLLWIIPFLIIEARSQRDIIAIILFDILTYIYFPISYGFSRGNFYAIFIAVIIVKTGFILYFFFHSFFKVHRDIGFIYKSS